MHTTNLKTLCDILSECDEAFYDDVMLSSQYPNQYVCKYTSRLKQRGITQPISNLVMIAIVDGLIEVGLLAELDWKEGGDSLINASVQLARVRKLPARIINKLQELEISEEEDASDTMEKIDLLLQTDGYTFVMIDIGADCYPLTILSLAKYKSLIATIDTTDKRSIFNFT